MVNLILTVIAITIMIAVVIAGLSYLGPAFGNASRKAVAAQFINGGLQIDGANQLRRVENDGVETLDTTPGSAVSSLVSDGYLKAVPVLPKGVTANGAPWTVTMPAGTRKTIISIELDATKPETAALCAELAKTRGFGCTSDLSSVDAP